MLNNISHLGSILGKGSLAKITPLDGRSIEAASLQENRTVVEYAGKRFSNVITLESESKTIVAIASESDTGHWLICPGGVEKCSNEYLLPTEQKGNNKLIMHSSFSKRRYVVELYKDKFIYRIQDKNCLIKYPHGCLIYGLGWHDQYTYEFKR